MPEKAKRNAILQAAKNGDLFLVKNLLSDDIDLDPEFKSKNVHPRVLPYLVQNFYCNATFADYLRIFNYCLNCSDSNAMEILKFLIEERITVESMLISCMLEEKNPRANTIFNLLLNLGRPIKNISRVLIVAVRSEKIREVSALISYGADVQTHDNICLDIAVELENLSLVKLLLEHGANPDERENIEKNHYPLTVACENVSVDIVKELLNRGANFTANSNSILMCAVKGNDLELLKWLESKQVSLASISAVVTAAGKSNEIFDYLMDKIEYT